MSGQGSGNEVPVLGANHATTTRFTISDRGTQMLGEDLANNRDWCYRAAASHHGEMTGPHSPCTLD